MSKAAGLQACQQTLPPVVYNLTTVNSILKSSTIKAIFNSNINESNLMVNLLDGRYYL
jgi:hypothetical protein